MPLVRFVVLPPCPPRTASCIDFFFHHAVAEIETYTAQLKQAASAHDDAMSNLKQAHDDTLRDVRRGARFSPCPCVVFIFVFFCVSLLPVQLQAGWDGKEVALRSQLQSAQTTHDDTMQELQDTLQRTEAELSELRHTAEVQARFIFKLYFSDLSLKRPPLFSPCARAFPPPQRTQHSLEAQLQDVTAAHAEEVRAARAELAAEQDTTARLRRQVDALSADCAEKVSSGRSSFCCCTLSASMTRGLCFRSAVSGRQSRPRASRRGQR